MVSGKKEKLWNANYNRVMFTNFTLFFSFYLLTPLLPLYLSETFGASKDMIGIVLSGYTLVALLARPFSGFAVDSFPRKTVELVFLFCYFLLFGGYLVAGSLMLFAVIRTLHGAPFGASTVANSTMAIDVLPESRRKEGIGFYGISNNLGSALAPTIGIMLYQYTHDFDTLFWLAFIVAFLGITNAWMVKHPNEKPERNMPETGASVSTSQAAGPESSLLSRFFLTRGWYLALNILFFGFCWGLLSNYLAIYSKEYLGVTGGTGTYFMLLSIGLILSRLQGNKSLRDGRLLYNATIGIVLSTLGYGIFIICPSNVGYYLSAALIGFGNGHMWPAFQNMIIAIARPNERGTANSTILTSWDLGMGLGILTGGIVAEYLGYAAAFWLNAALHVCGFLVFLLIVRRRFSQQPGV